MAAFGSLVWYTMNVVSWCIPVSCSRSEHISTTSKIGISALNHTQTVGLMKSHVSENPLKKPCPEWKCPQRCACAANSKTCTLSVDCTNRKLSDIPDIPPTTTRLLLSKNRLTIIPKSRFSKLKDLIEMDLSKNRIQTLETDSFRGLSKLESLYVQSNLLHDPRSVALRAFEPLTRLTTLYIANNCKSEESCRALVREISTVTSLINLVVDGYPGMVFNKSFGNLTNLTSIGFGGTHGKCDLQYVTKQTFLGLANCPLEIIELNDCNIKQVQSGSFSTLVYLRSLSLSYNRELCHDGWRNVTIGLNNTRIESLGLDSNCVNLHPDTHVVSESDLSPLFTTQLLSLDLHHCNLQVIEPGVIARALPRSLRRLILYNNDLNNGVPLLFMPWLTNLEYLDISIQNRYNHAGNQRNVTNQKRYNHAGYQGNVTNQNRYDHAGNQRNVTNQNRYNHAGYQGNVTNQNRYNHAGYQGNVTNQNRYNHAGNQRNVTNQKRYNHAGNQKNGTNQKRYNHAGYQGNVSNQNRYNPAGNQKNGTNQKRYNHAGYQGNVSNQNRYNPAGTQKNGTNQKRCNHAGYQGNVTNQNRYNPAGNQRNVTFHKASAAEAFDKACRIKYPIGLILLPHKLRFLNASNLNLEYAIPPVSFHPNNSLEVADGAKCLLSRICGKVAGLHHLKFLNFSNNRIIHVGHDAFSDMPQLEDLNLSGNPMGETFDDDRSVALFQNLTMLNTLDLSSTVTRRLPTAIFSGLKNLRVLKLGNNALETLQFNIDAFMETLQLLDISNNSIKFLPDLLTSELDRIAKPSWFSLLLSNNKLWCNCQYLSFTKWLANTKVNIVDRSSITCRAQNATAIRLDDLRHVQVEVSLDCVTWIVLTACVSFFLCSMTFLGLVAALYRQRWKLRYLYYASLKRVNPYMRLDDHADNTSDIYLSFDEDHVLGDGPRLYDVISVRVVNALRQHGITAKIREDLSAGKSLNSEISSVILQSNKTVIFLSRDYCKEFWNTFEFNMAAYDGMYTNRKTIIPVVVGQVGSSDLLPEMNAFLDKEIVISFDVQHFEEFIEQLVYAISK